MKVQIVTYNVKDYEDFQMCVSSLSQPKSLDAFDINIIDLGNSNIWKYVENSTRSIDCIDDFKSIHSMLLNSVKAHNIIALPQNETFRFFYTYVGNNHKGYTKQCKLKDMINNLGGDILPCILGMPLTNIILYDNSETKKVYSASFCFRDGFGNCLTKSDGSDKVTTIRVRENIIYTFLNILQSREALVDFLKLIHEFPDEHEACPQWVADYDFNDDAIQKGRITDKQKEIEEANRVINEAEEQLKQNLEYKSILYTNGNQLVQVVFKILEKILDCKLSGFIDNMEEDFLIKFSDITFIGEIKGVTSNVKAEHVSQLDTNYHKYMDKLEEENKTENVKQLLIINPCRNRRLEEREPVHENQIRIAKRNQSLIIETSTLLKIFENFILGKMTSQEIIELFTSRDGILQLD